ncbi:MAG: hypothetical protein JWO36_2056 [Myxococcales bacterium]|nr:hypothetical protein [Myxococcales bacterium]
MSIVDRIREERRSHQRRLDKARAAIRELTVDERNEILAEMVDAVEREEPSPSLKKAAPLKQSQAHEVVDSAKFNDAPLRVLIVEVMRDAPPLGTHEIYEAVTSRFPNLVVMKNSVAAQVHRLSTIQPPVLVQKGENAKGHPLYGLANNTKAQLRLG